MLDRDILLCIRFISSSSAGSACVRVCVCACVFVCVRVRARACVLSLPSRPSACPHSHAHPPTRTTHARTSRRTTRSQFLLPRNTNERPQRTHVAHHFWHRQSHKACHQHHDDHWVLQEGPRVVRLPLLEELGGAIRSEAEKSHGVNGGTLLVFFFLNTYRSFKGYGSLSRWNMGVARTFPVSSSTSRRIGANCMATKSTCNTYDLEAVVYASQEK